MSCFQGLCASSAVNNVLNQSKTTEYQNNNTTVRPNVNRNNEFAIIAGKIVNKRITRISSIDTEILHVNRLLYQNNIEPNLAIELESIKNKLYIEKNKLEKQIINNANKEIKKVSNISNILSRPLKLKSKRNNKKVNNIKKKISNIEQKILETSEEINSKIELIQEINDRIEILNMKLSDIKSSILDYLKKKKLSNKNIKNINLSEHIVLKQFLIRKKEINKYIEQNKNQIAILEKVTKAIKNIKDKNNEKLDFLKLELEVELNSS
jgi:hypothetical protein